MDIIGQSNSEDNDAIQDLYNRITQLQSSVIANLFSEKHIAELVGLVNIWNGGPSFSQGNGNNGSGSSGTPNPKLDDKLISQPISSRYCYASSRLTASRYLALLGVEADVETQMNRNQNES